MEKPEKPYLAHLDGLRGGAALWVLLAHCVIWSGWKWTRLPDPKIAVDIFMVISGYLMAHNWHPTSSARSFWLRRFFRIAPAYYLSLAVAACLSPWFLGDYAVLYRHLHWPRGGPYDPSRIRFTPVNWAMHLSFLFGMFPRWSYSTMLPDWSIGLEMQFYAVFPFLIRAMRRHQVALIVVGALLAKFITIRWTVFPEPSFLLLKLLWFLVGILAAESLREHNPLLAIAALTLSACYADRLVTLATAVLLYLGMAPTAPLHRLFGNRFSRFLADMSYCVYLFHGFFVAFVGAYLFQKPWFVSRSSPIQAALLAGGVVPLSYGLAWVIHHAVERPGITWGRRIIASRPRR